MKHFFVDIRKTRKDDEGKEYEPGSPQTCRNSLRRYFLHRPCPPAPDNFDIEKNEKFDEVANMLSVKKKDFKRKGLENKPNAAQPLEEDETEKIWSTGALGLQNPRSLLHLVWWNNVKHLGMRAFKEQYDCLIQDFTVTNQYVEYKERQSRIAKETKKVRGKVPESTTTKSGRLIEESGTHTEHSLSMSHIVRKVKPFLEIFSSLHWTNQHQTFGIKQFPSVEIPLQK